MLHQNSLSATVLAMFVSLWELTRSLVTRASIHVMINVATLRAHSLDAAVAT